MKNWELVFIKNISFICSYKAKENSNNKKNEAVEQQKFSVLCFKQFIKKTFDIATRGILSQPFHS